MILGEFGLDTTSPAALDYVQRVYDEAGDHGFSVAYWSRDDGSWGPYEDGEPRNLVDSLAKPYPRATAGEIGKIEASDSQLSFDVKPDPDIDSPTEVWLPKSFGDITNDDNGEVSGVDVDGAQVLGWQERSRILLLRIDDDARTVTIK